VNPRRVLTVFGTRPEAIKLFPVLHALRDDPRFVSVACVTGQHRGMLDQVLGIAGIVPDHDLALMRPEQSLDRLTAALLTGLGEVIDAARPEWVVVQGDTATAMAGALAAYYRKIPVAHVEAGLRSGNIHHPWPEEVNRRIIGTIAALHAAPTETAAAALRAETVDPAAIHVTGNTVIDALRWIVARTEADASLAADIAVLETRFAGRRIIGVTSHRRENFGKGMRAIAAAIRRIAARPGVAIVFPVHLNPNVRGVMQAELAGLDNVALIEPLDYPNFARLIAASTLMLTDSGGVQEEAPALGKPVLVMRETTERPEGVAAGTARLVGVDPDRIVAETFRLLDDASAYAAMARAHNPFGDGQAAGRIVELLARGRRDPRAG
jgi:UDP-N-acetylglucosamine 2-epimerase (non-hydrolysing)